ncbi:MAG: queuosine precursor transporter [Patescibacteria group bacterium]
MQTLVNQENKSEKIDKRYKHLGTISVLFVSVLLISNIVSTKIIDLGFFSFDGGTLIFPLSYIFGDILTEVYGFRQSRKVIWLGFICALLMSVTIILIGKLPADPNWTNQNAYDVILGLTPRLVIASLIAYFAGEFSNAIILAKLKIRTKGRWLWSRTIASTVIGQLIDSLLFIVIAFSGILPKELLISLIISNYVFKLAFEIVLTPATYKVVNYLKKSEQEDYYDINTKFNPLHIGQDNESK